MYQHGEQRSFRLGTESTAIEVTRGKRQHPWQVTWWWWWWWYVSSVRRFLCLLGILMSFIICEMKLWKVWADLGSCFSSCLCLGSHRTLQLDWQANVLAATHTQRTLQHSGHGFQATAARSNQRLTRRYQQALTDKLKPADDVDGQVLASRCTIEWAGESTGYCMLWWPERYTAKHKPQKKAIIDSKTHGVYCVSVLSSKIWLVLMQ